MAEITVNERMNAPMEKENFKNVFIASGDPDTMQEMCAHTEDIGLSVSGTTSSAKEAFCQSVKCPPDIIIADYVLSDGDALELCQRLKNTDSPPVTVILLPYINGFISSRLAQTAPDCFLLKPVGRDRLAKTISDFSGYRRNTFLHSGVDMERRVSDMLFDLGIPARLLGHRYILDALLSVSPEQLRIPRAMDGVYRSLANLHGTTPARVERNMRNAIETAFDRCSPDTLEKYFGNSVSFDRGKPTNGELLSCLAEKLALETKGI